MRLALHDIISLTLAASGPAFGAAVVFSARRSRTPLRSRQRVTPFAPQVGGGTVAGANGSFGGFGGRSTGTACPTRSPRRTIFPPISST